MMLKKIKSFINKMRRRSETEVSYKLKTEAIQEAMEASCKLFLSLAETLSSTPMMTPDDRRKVLVGSLSQIVKHMDEDSEDLADELFYALIQRVLLHGLIMGLGKHGDQPDLIAWTIASSFEEAARRMESEAK